MTYSRNLLVLAASLAALAGCAKTTPPTADGLANANAIRAIENASIKAYNAGDSAALAAFYAEDAVLNAPGAPAARGRPAIKAYYAKDAPAFAAAGLTESVGAMSDVGMSGDLAWQSGAYTITDRSGAVVDAGKYVMVFQRKDEKWMILRDTWNSDSAPPASAAVPPGSARPPK